MSPARVTYGYGEWKLGWRCALQYFLLDGILSLIDQRSSRNNFAQSFNKETNTQSTSGT